jgi:hypothetical protein
MAVSNSSDFSLTRDQIIRRALRLIGKLKQGETPGAQVVTNAAEALNAMGKRWQKKPGMRVWTVTEATLFPQASQSRYALSSSSTDHATETFYETTISADEAASQTTLSVTSTDNMTVADNIGIVVDDGSVHWSTIASKTSSTVTINDAIDDSAAAGNVVFNYTTKIVRPLKIVDARRYNIASAIDTPISDSQGSLMARLDYQALPNKAQTGTINRAFYDPQRDTGYLHLWQPPTTVTDLVKFTWHRPIMDFDSASDNPDLPQEWFDALAFNLAVTLAPEFDVPMEKLQTVATMAASYLEDVQGDDREGESLFMQADAGY